MVKGKTERDIEIARLMIQKGFSIENITEIIGVDDQRIKLIFYTIKSK